MAKVIHSISQRFSFFMLRNIAKLSEKYSLAIATKSQKYKSEGPWKLPEISEYKHTGNKVRDQTVQPKEIHEKVN